MSRPGDPPPGLPPTTVFQAALLAVLAGLLLIAAGVRPPAAVEPAMTIRPATAEEMHQHDVDRLLAELEHRQEVAR